MEAFWLCVALGVAGYYKFRDYDKQIKQLNEDVAFIHNALGRMMSVIYKYRDDEK